MKKTLNQWLAWQETLHLSEIDLGLERIKKVAEALGLLTPPFPIITVAGTNGKGSSVAMLDAILCAESYKTGTYTSPHLIDYNERIKLNTINASDALIIHAFEKINEVRNKIDISLTYFEFGALAALFIFKEQAVDIAILEVGLGGRLDAANLWDASLAIITNIGIDHIAWLGDNRDSITIEKAGIMRKDRPTICGDIDPPRSLRQEAERIGTRYFEINHDFKYHQNNASEWVWEGFNQRFTLPTPLLKGDFQLNNAATIIAGLLQLKSLPVSLSSIQTGLQTAKVNGRLEILSTSPEWLIDVAHNPHAAKTLVSYLNKHPVSGKTYALFSMLKDKDINSVLAIMDSAIDEWHLIGLGGNRGLRLNELKQQIKQQKLKGNMTGYTDIKQACHAIKKITKAEDRVVAFGSFLVVSDVITHCKDN